MENDSGGQNMHEITNMRMHGSFGGTFVAYQKMYLGGVKSVQSFCIQRVYDIKHAQQNVCVSLGNAFTETQTRKELEESINLLHCASCLQIEIVILQRPRLSS
jgi:hypothetical protein